MLSSADSATAAEREGADVGRVRPGDGHALPRYRWWQLFSRSLFHLRLDGEGGASETWSVDVRHGGDSNGEVYVQLYLDGVNQARAKPPASFPVPGGLIEVVTSNYGLRRCHYVTPDGTQRQLVPDPAATEGRRARLARDHPALSRGIGFASVIVLAFSLLLGVPQIVEQITQIPPIAERIGTFLSPFHLPAWANISLVLATLVASTERALRLRYNSILDSGLFGGD
ncbi:hypothetical protein [Micromonospora sp. WMMD1082]|uniref:hypothetical protein n=1 Tax=Micromonospora sp. WMMD1082 TaxID=3016104 RepID=UPI0024162EA2|nr:hypothetical protein [Micromonospora sp. WMMD1082]MDG4798918.1 hypothetical protein [Micromonospora sp. WMMD1082]